MQIHIRITDEIHKKLKELKNKQGLPFSWTVRRALEKYFENKKIKKE